MCVIAVYGKGTPFNYGELKTCFKNNPDGAGVMWQENDHVHIRKGFMKSKPLMSFLTTLPNNVDRVVHFRIATSGKVGGACCHPFPVVDDLKKMMETDTIAKVAYTHNGILTDYTPKAGLKSPFSDTMVFGKDVLAHLLKSNIDLFDPVIDTMIESTIDGDRMVIMDKESLTTMGRFYTSTASGAMYSNETYKKARYHYAPLRVYDDYGWGEWYQGANGTYTKSPSKNVTPSYIVTFQLDIGIDTKQAPYTNWTKVDMEEFIALNLDEYGVTMESIHDNGVVDGKMMFSCVCWYYSGLSSYPFIGLVSVKKGEKKDIACYWKDTYGVRNCLVNMQVSDVESSYCK